MADIVMPRLSDTMEEGTVLRWLKGDGEAVRRGDELVEIETDKANMVYESPDAGRLEIVAAEGDTVAVGQPIAAIRALSQAVIGASAGNGASEAARGEVTIKDLSRLQKTVARRMADSKSAAPDFALTVAVDMQAVVDLRSQLKDSADPAPSVNDFVVKASASALKAFPRANSTYRDGRLELYSRVNIGIAVAAQEALVVPTIFDADQKSLQQIALEARIAADRVRSGAITEPELSSGTFTVSNLGMFGIEDFVAIINQPQAAILAVGEVTPSPVVRHAEMVIKPIARLTLTCDHRVLYGAEAAGFLSRIRQGLEEPSGLVG
jgi:pyruvate dehydrogenase E2 component (dihydrolipoyllysine-residue acetyltransferase)